MEKMPFRRHLQRIMEESDMENITMKINGVQISVPAGSTILEAGPDGPILRSPHCVT